MVNEIHPEIKRLQHISINEFLLRDDLLPEEYIKINYNICDFYEKDISSQELEFFDPLAKKTPSKAWGNVMTTDYTMARKNIEGPYYRVMKLGNSKILFADVYEPIRAGSFTGYEYRRIYFSLKFYYNNPTIMFIDSLDDRYSHIKFYGHLPNREYFFLLLIAWPQNGVSDKSNFIIKNEFLTEIVENFAKIGIVARRTNNG